MRGLTMGVWTGATEQGLMMRKAIHIRQLLGKEAIPSDQSGNPTSDNICYVYIVGGAADGIPSIPGIVRVSRAPKPISPPFRSTRISGSPLPALHAAGMPILPPVPVRSPSRWKSAVLSDIPRPPAASGRAVVAHLLWSAVDDLDRSRRRQPSRRNLCSVGWVVSVAGQSASSAHAEPYRRGTATGCDDRSAYGNSRFRLTVSTFFISAA